MDEIRALARERRMIESGVYEEPDFSFLSKMYSEEELKEAGIQLDSSYEAPDSVTLSSVVREDDNSSEEKDS